MGAGHQLGSAISFRTEAANLAMPIDLLVTDVGLPSGMNGRQVADTARTMRPDLKVLFVTGYAENVVLSGDVLDLRTRVLTKPFAMAVLADRVRELIALA